MSEPKKYPNKLGVKGWAVGGRWGFERFLYTLHRISGLAILFYFVLHIFVTSTRVLPDNGETWNALMAFLTQPGVNVGEFLVFLAFAFHACNGVRLIFIELFGAVGKPIEPIYPYKTSLHATRPLMIVLMIIALIFIAAGTYDFIVLGH